MSEETETIEASAVKGSVILEPEPVNAPAVIEGGAALPKYLPQLSQTLDKLVNRRNLPPEILQQYLDLTLKVMQYQKVIDFNAAMVKFRKISGIVEHNKRGKTAGSAPFSYADYPRLVAAVSPWLDECELTFIHECDPPVMLDSGLVSHQMFYCVVRHVSGHEERIGPYAAVPDPKLRDKLSPMQSLQQPGTYAKRQLLAMALGIGTSEDKFDDDGPREYTDRGVEASASRMSEEAPAPSGDLSVTATDIEAQIRGATSIDALNKAQGEIRNVPDVQDRSSLRRLAGAKARELAK